MHIRSCRIVANGSRVYDLGLAKYFGAFDADSQPRAPFGATCLEHIASAGGTHFAAKAMDTQAVQTFGLIRSFHDILLQIRTNTASVRTISWMRAMRPIMAECPKKSRGENLPRKQAQIIHARW